MPKKGAALTEIQDKTSGGEPSPPEAHIAVCDDDRELRDLLATFLQEHGFRVSQAGGGRELNRVMSADPPVDLVILDVMLPGQTGLQICKELRAGTIVPILMLTARGNEDDRIIGLELGADDYMSKPFSPNELLARVKALLRRAKMHDASSDLRARIMTFAGWSLDRAKRELRNPDGVVIDLSAGEYDLLIAFLEAPQRVLARDHLLETSRNRGASGFDRSIDVQVSRLRRKICGSDDSEGLIKTVRGSGYMFIADVRPK